MSDDPSPASDHNAASQVERTSVIFHGMVMQLANMAMLLMGKVPHPQSGQITVDMDAARMFIDQLEMLSIKTKGNLDKHEDSLLRHHLMTLRLAYVDAVNQQGSGAAKAASVPGASPEPTAAAPDAAETSVAEEESRKKFTKKY